MEKKQYDLVVIGSGPGGYVAAVRAAQLGLKTACIEKDPRLGGTCLNVGCIPSKTLLYSSEHYEWIKKESEQQGIDVKDVSFSLDRMMERKNQVVKGLTDSVAVLFKKHDITCIEGTAQLKSSHLIEVQGKKSKQIVEASNIILATGSEPAPLPFLPFDEKTVLSSTGALALSAVPKRLIVIGAGIIGVELASVYNRLGSKVTLIEMLDTICTGMDHSITRMLQQILKKQGLEFHLGAKVLKADKTNEGIILSVEENGLTNTYTGDAVLVAVGRRPYTKGLNLNEFGIAVDSKGFVTVDSNFRTSLPHIYAIGDIIEGPMLAHKASEEGVAVAEIIAGREPHLNYLAIPNVIYTHPEVAAVGMTESEARALGLELKIGTCQFRANARARCTGYLEGVVKVIGESSSGRLIGMHILGPAASEMIGEGVIAIEKKATLQEIGRASHAHPTLSESIKEASLQALGEAIHI